MRYSISRLAYFILFSVAFTASLLAQGTPQNPHVQWKLVTPTVKGSPGAVVDVKVEVKLVPKSHIYSLSTGGASPTEVTVGEKKIATLGGKVRASRRPHRSYDVNFEDTTEYWEKGVTFTVPVKIAKGAKVGSKAKAWVNFNYMTCDDARCIPPLDEKFTFEVTIEKDTAMSQTVTDSTDESLVITETDTADRTTAATTIDTTAKAGTTEKNTDTNATAAVGNGTEKSKKKDKDDDGGLIAYLLQAAGAGFLAWFTPCVYPLIPITVSFFTKRNQTTRRKSFRDASLYGFGIIITFSLIGLIVSLLFGPTGLNELATNPIANLVIAAVFIALALSLFGLFEIQIPTSVLNRLNKAANDKGDSVTGIMLMGVVFSLTSFTCTVPFVSAALTSVSEGDLFRPLMGSIAFALVFSFPFFLLALFPFLMKSLPKSGGWLNSVKVVMGFLEIAFALKFLSNVDIYYRSGVLTRELFLAIWVAIAVIASVYLLGRFQLTHDSPVERVGPVRLLFSVFFLSIGFWLLTGLFGGRLGEVDPFLPPQHYPGKGNTSLLSAVVMGSPESTVAATDTGGAGNGKKADPHAGWIIDDYEKALATARETGKPIFVDFTGIFCTNCRWMEQNIFTLNDVRSKLDGFVRVQLFTDQRDPVNKKNQRMLLERFDTIELPFYALITPGDSVIAARGFESRISGEEFITFLEQGLKEDGKMAVK